MKFRSGFVSNSSSSSFSLYGIVLEPTEKCQEKDDAVYEAQEAAEKFGLEFETMCDYDDMWLGVSWCRIKDDQTGKEFKQFVEEGVKKFLAKHKGLFVSEKLVFGHHEEAWRDG